jgi:hypothetical protein
MIKELGVAEAREQFTRIPEIFEEEPDTSAIEVKRHGKTIFAVIPLHLYEEIAETLEILADKDFYSELKAGIKDLEEDNTFTLEEVKKELGL